MSERLSYCGLICQTCPIYLVTREADKGEQRRKRAEIAKLCQEQYGKEYKPADITDCDGCRTEGGRLFSGCHECRIRQCAKRKRIENYAYCTEYVCPELESFFVKELSAKARLDKVRNQKSPSRC
jgi:hypothetical protein